MVLDICSQDAQVLYDLLDSHLPELRREVARTDDREFRHMMEQRQEVCERLLAHLIESGVEPDTDSAEPVIARPAA